MKPSDLARSLAEQPRAVTLFGAPEGHDAAAIGGLVADSGVASWLHVCRDDGRMARFAAALAFFHPGLEVLTFPAWDCLPYDRVSPNGEIASRRIDTLTRLAAAREPKPLVVLTTVNALVQRVPPRKLFDGRVLTLGPGGRIPLDRLQSFLPQQRLCPHRDGARAGRIRGARRHRRPLPGGRGDSRSVSISSATRWKACAASTR